MSELIKHWLCNHWTAKLGILRILPLLKFFDPISGTYPESWRSRRLSVASGLLSCSNSSSNTSGSRFASKRVLSLHNVILNLKSWLIKWEFTLNRSRPHRLYCAYWRMSACCVRVVIALSQHEVDWQTAVHPRQLSILSSSLVNLSPNWSGLSKWQLSCRIDETQAHRPIPNLYFLWLFEEKKMG